MNRRVVGAVWILAACVWVSMVVAVPAHASLSRNAAGAKNMGEFGRLTIDTAGQLDRDGDGQAWLFETSVQYQASKRLQLLVEGTPLESVRPDVGENVSGFGDIDVTVSWLTLPPTPTRPSVVLGARAKLPTASREQLGSGKADYSALLVVGKELGELELNTEAEYVRYGQPGGEKLKDQFLYTLTAEFAFNDYLAVYGEAFGQSAPVAGESTTHAARGGIEIDIPLRERIAPYLSFDLDTEGASAARFGVEWKW